MAANLVSFVISEEFRAAVFAKFAELIALFTFLVDLDVEGRKRLAKMGRKHADFTKRGFKLGELYPRFIPSFSSLEEFGKDMDVSTYLRKLQEEFGAFLDKIEDTAMQAESEAYHAARGIYTNAKIAAKAGDEEAERVIKDLGVHFKRNTAPVVEEPDTEETKE